MLYGHVLCLSNVLNAYVLHDYICICSMQFRMLYMEKSYRNKIIIIIIIADVIIIIIIIIIIISCSSGSSGVSIIIINIIIITSIITILLLFVFHCKSICIKMYVITVIVVCWLLKVLATGSCISGTALLRQFYVLPH